MPANCTEGFYEQAVTLDEFARTHAAPGFIKMDIEGGETEALAGASEVFTKNRPLLLLEVHHPEAEEFTKKWLKEQAYEHEWLPPGPGKLPPHMLAWPSSRVHL